MQGTQVTLRQVLGGVYDGRHQYHRPPNFQSAPVRDNIMTSSKLGHQPGTVWLPLVFVVS